MRIALLYGGKSGEHEVSLSSATSILRNLNPSHKIQLIGVAKTGGWFLQPDSVLSSCRDEGLPLELRTDGPSVLVVPGKGLRVYGARGSADLPVDVVFPVLHGTFGEDGTIQGLLECAELAYVGADVLGSAIGMDKEVSKEIWKAAGLPVVPSMTVHDYDAAGLGAIAADVGAAFGWPAFVKPASCGSSVGAFKVESASDFPIKVRDSLAYDTKVLVEPFISAREIECSVLGNEAPRAFAPGEIVPSHEFYDYDAKYIDPEGASFLIPAPLDAAMAARVMDTAIAAYRLAKLSGMARVDFFIDRRDGVLYLNEVNTIPGFTSISMYPKMCEAGGLPYGSLLDELLELAVSRRKKRTSLRYERG